MSTFIKRLVAFAIAAGAVWLVYAASTRDTSLKGLVGGAKRGTQANGDAPSPVLLGAAKLADVPVVLEGVGTVKALNTVTVKALVEGKILKYNFSEGQFVKKGDVVAEIDPAPYKAMFDQAAAKKQVDETQLFNARKDLERYKSITAGVIAQKTVDTQEALVRQLTAQVAADSAAVASAQTTLDYTKVVAPIDGRTGIRLIDAGNVSRTGDAGIVVLTQLQPVTVLFTLPQQQLPQIAKAMAAGDVAVDVMDSDNKIALDKGRLMVVDNQVDQATGTIKLKAELPNDKLQLWPGKFVNVRVLVETLRQVVVVPTPAIQRGPTGIYVFTTADGQRVSQRPIAVGLQTDATSVVTSGIAPGDRVVTTGFARLQDGARISVTAPAAATGADKRQPGKTSQSEGAVPASGEQPAAKAMTVSTPDSSPGKDERKRGEGKRRRDSSAAGVEAKTEAPARASVPQ